VTLELLRQGQRITKRVAVLERPRDPDRILAHLEGENSVVAPLGILGVSLTPEVMTLLPPLRRFSGVVVAGLLADFATEENSLRAGDVIYEANRQRVADLQGLREIAATWRSGQPVALLIERMGQLQILMLERP
jgi:serine protease Do